MQISELLLECKDLKKSDISHLDNLTQYKVLLTELQNKQTRELNDLLYSNHYTPEKEDELRALHKLKEENFTKQFYKTGQTTADKIETIQAKKNITVKEFAEIYNISKTSQRDYRSRLNDPLPYHQKVLGGKIVYVVAEVEQWFENQHK